VERGSDVICSNCGKGIPFAGRVCPYCHADKTPDQFWYAWAFVGAILGGIIGWLATEDVGWIIGGLFAGGIAGFAFAGNLLARRR